MTKEQKIENFKKTPHCARFRKAIEEEIPDIYQIKWCYREECNVAFVETRTITEFGVIVWHYYVSCDFGNNYKLQTRNSFRSVKS